jgi:hypothetical protein
MVDTLLSHHPLLRVRRVLLSGWLATFVPMTTGHLNFALVPGIVAAAGAV